MDRRRIFPINQLTHVLEQKVDKRLEGLGLDQKELREVVRQGQFTFFNCTENHPPIARGIWAWGETVCALREYLLPKGWKRSEENNYSLVISPDDRIAIAVCTGDENTGVPNATPSNKAHKGSSTKNAIIYNQLELGLPPETSFPSLLTRANYFQNQQVTWILLVHRADDEVRCELSLPSSFGTGQIDDWKERILLKPIPLNDGQIHIPQLEAQDISVTVRRKT